MKYFRTYLVSFITPSGKRYYAGKHESKHQDPSSDPYTGSGTYAKRAIAKYGTDCVDRIVWYTHDSEYDMSLHEIGLIRTTKSTYGDLCVNIAEGGGGGNTIKHMSEKDYIAFREKLRTHARSSLIWNHYDELLTLWKTTDAVGGKQFGLLAVANGFPDARYDRMIKCFCSDTGLTSRTNTEAKRSTGIWKHQDELYKLWASVDKPSETKFRRIANENGFPDARYDRMIKVFRDCCL